MVIHIFLKYFPKISFKMFHARFSGPFQIVRRIASHACGIELPTNLDTSSIFNAKDLLLCHGAFKSLSLSIDLSCSNSIDS